MNDSPKVFVKQEFEQPLPFNKFSQNQLFSLINGMFNYYSKEDKRPISMFDYYVGKINKEERVNLVLENGKYATEEEVAKLKKQYQKHIQESNMWKMIISFNNDYIDKNVTLPQLEQKMVKEILPRFFKECGFKDVKNMSYQVALHTDTDNYHFHIAFIEKKPNYINSLNQLTYRKKGLFSRKELNFLKNQTALSIERESIIKPAITEANKEIDLLKTYFDPKDKNFSLKHIDKKDLILEYKLMQLGKLISEERDSNNYRKIKYNSIKNEDIKTLTKDIKKYMFSDKDSALYQQKENMEDSLKKINNIFFKLSEDNHISKLKFKSDYVKEKEAYIDNYIYNAIVNHANYRYRKTDKIKMNNIIKEIAYKQYSNKKYRAFDLLLDCFSNSKNSSKLKYKYKHEYEQALKNINQEMEEASKEFSKLFNNEEEKNESYEY